MTSIQRILTFSGFWCEKYWKAYFNQLLSVKHPHTCQNVQHRSLNFNKFLFPSLILKLKKNLVPLPTFSVPLPGPVPAVEKCWSSAQKNSLAMVLCDFFSVLLNWSIFRLLGYFQWFWRPFFLDLSFWATLKKIAQNWFQVDLSMPIWKFQCFDVYYFETQRCFDVFVYWYLKTALMYVFWTFPKLGEFFNISSNTVCFGSCLHVLTCELNTRMVKYT